MYSLTELRALLQCGKKNRKVTRTITMFTERTADLQNCNNVKKHRANALCFFYIPTQETHPNEVKKASRRRLQSL